ncbi:PARP-domain-containing protein [Hymenopellis radicata]|nr:PARP-domain-containing protein [Hymenopellis radicata]
MLSSRCLARCWRLQRAIPTRRVSRIQHQRVLLGVRSIPSFTRFTSTSLSNLKATVDPYSNKTATHDVLSNEEGIWDAMLNQTDISGQQNSNKFYILQLLHVKGNTSKVWLFARWGRVGEDQMASTKLHGPWSEDEAVKAFKKQFRAKSGAKWENRFDMVAKKGKYLWLERALEEDKVDSTASSVPESTLDPETQAFCNLIFSKELIAAHLSAMNYNFDKLPLGQLGKHTIKNGFEALKNLSDAISNASNPIISNYPSQQDALEHLSGIIPHYFGRAKPLVIDTTERLKNELDLVEALQNMQVGTQMMSQAATDETGNPINPMDAHFRSLDLDYMTSLAKDTQEYTVLSQFVADNHGSTHTYRRAQVDSIFKLGRSCETEAWKHDGWDDLQESDRLLLWHGSRTANFAGILKQGLRIAPPEAPVNGYMYGKGVYFADVIFRVLLSRVRVIQPGNRSSGFNFCRLSENKGVLLLCEVAAKPFYHKKHGSFNADAECKEKGKRSTKGLGRHKFAKWKDAGEALGVPELRGCVMPDGSHVLRPKDDFWLDYTEYIVYNTSQIRMKYLFVLNF